MLDRVRWPPHPESEPTKIHLKKKTKRKFNRHPEEKSIKKSSKLFTFDVEADDVAALVSGFHHRRRRNDGTMRIGRDRDNRSSSSGGGSFNGNRSLLSVPKWMRRGKVLGGFPVRLLSSCPFRITSAIFSFTPAALNVT